MVARSTSPDDYGDISLGKLRVRMGGPPDCDGDVDVLATVPVTNKSGHRQYVDVYYQGLDADGFEMLSLNLYGLVPAEAVDFSLAKREVWVKQSTYKKIAKWQVQLVSSDPR